MTLRVLAPAAPTTSGFSISELIKETAPWLAASLGVLLSLILWDNYPQAMAGAAIAVLALVVIDFIVAFAVRFGPSEESLKAMAMPAGELRAAIRNPWGN